MTVQREHEIGSSERADLEIIQYQDTIAIDVSVTGPSVVGHQKNLRYGSTEVGNRAVIQFVNIVSTILHTHELHNTVSVNPVHSRREMEDL